jgi:hypothetical protein
VIASIHGIQVAADKGVGHVILETDALEVVQVVYSDAFDLSAVTFIQIQMAEWKRQETKKVGGIGGTRLSKWERP